MSERLVGVTVLPEYFQSEGVKNVVNRLVTHAGVNAITTSPYVMEIADAKTGRREPPVDAGAGKVRLLDRPLWGKRELYVRTAPSFVPDRSLYKGLRYQPSAPTALTMREGKILQELIRTCQGSHVKVYLQVQAAIPPGYRVQFGGPVKEDQPQLPDGRIPPRRLAQNGCLASPHIRGYTEALLADLCKHYPDIAGIRVDWPEYPPYFLDDVFLDFNPQVKIVAKRQSLDFARMQQDVLALYRKLHGSLTDRDLECWLDPDGGRFSLIRLIADYPGLADWLRLKALLVEELLQGFRKAMDNAGGNKIELIGHAFPPPWSLVSGMDFGRAGKYCAAICVKLYSMHWAMMLRFYADVIRKANPRLSDKLLVQTLVRMLDIADDQGLSKCDDYYYPPPDKAHPVGSKALSAKITQAQRAAGKTPILVLTHGYGPVEDFRRRLIAGIGKERSFWVNRYAYLSDEKLKVIGEVVGNKK